MSLHGPLSGVQYGTHPFSLLSTLSVTNSGQGMFQLLFIAGIRQTFSLRASDFTLERKKYSVKRFDVTQAGWTVKLERLMKISCLLFREKADLVKLPNEEDGVTLN